MMIFFDEEMSYSLDTVVDKFMGYYKRPITEDEKVIVTKDDFYRSSGHKNTDKCKAGLLDVIDEEHSPEAIGSEVEKPFSKKLTDQVSREAFDDLFNAYQKLDEKYTALCRRYCNMIVNCEEE